MKISIITVTKNSESTILETLNSIYNQTYKNIEYIVVDGNSTDKTLEYIKQYPKKIKLINQKKQGIYNAFNIGIKHATGELIGILNSDDIFNNNQVIEKVINVIKKTNHDIYFGKVTYFRNRNYKNIVRLYDSSGFKSWHLKFGLMPPHTGTFIRKKVFQEFSYDENLKIASDYKFFLNTIYQNKTKYKKLNFIITRMKTGGIASRNLNSYIKSTIEILKSRQFSSFALVCIIFRGLFKIKQIIFTDIKNSHFQRIESKFLKKNLVYDFNICTNPNIVLKKYKKFIFSALNLAYLGFYAKKDIEKNRFFFHWPDGNFAKYVDSSLPKIPGRDILKYLKIPNSIKKIVILGNASDKTKKFLSNYYKRNIKHIVLPYGNFSEISKDIKYKFKKDELVFITLPTPKQEQIANYISKKNKYFKIFCIGASIAMLSGEEKPVPNFISSVEFLWRLKNDTFRRINRIFTSFFYFIATPNFSKENFYIKYEQR